MRAGLVLIAALVLAGCGTTERHGGVGDALKGDHVQAKLLRFVPPAAGKRLAAAELAVCNDTGAAAIPWRFELRLGGGSNLHPQPTSEYQNELETVRDGCDSG